MIQRSVLSVIWLVGAAILLTSCSSIVKQPNISDVRSAVILSIYAGETVSHNRGKGTISNWDNRVKLAVANDALYVYSKELQRLGWKIYSPKKAVQSKRYQTAFGPKAAALATDSYHDRFLAPTGMHPIALSSDHDQQAVAQREQVLVELAKRYRVDAVVVVQLDYCYEGGAFSIMGHGNAIMTAAASIKAVNQAGERVVDMPDIMPCAGKRGKSNQSTAMIANNLVFAPSNQQKIRAMFAEATRASARIAVDEIQAALSQ